MLTCGGVGNSWRTQRGPQNNANNNNANNNRQPQRGPASRDRSSANNVTAPQQNRPSSTGQRPAPGAVSGNAWNNGDRPARGGSNVGVMEDEHVPVRGFNAQETRDVLRRGYQDSMSGEQKATVYRAQNADANNARAGGPWNSKRITIILLGQVFPSPADLRSFPLNSKQHGQWSGLLRPAPEGDRLSSAVWRCYLSQLGRKARNGDDTSVAILEKNDATKCPPAGPKATLHHHVKVTSHDRRYGGIHPLVALDSHQMNLGRLVQEALQHLPRKSASSSSALGKPDFISVTRGPGMRANLNAGLDTAKGLSISWDIPLVGVNHMQAHALTPRLVSSLESPANSSGATEPAFPFLSLLVSGGHTMLIHSKALTNHTLLAETVDIAIGDMIDKAARNILPPAILNQADHGMYGQLLEQFAFPDERAELEYRPPATRADEVTRKQSSWGWSFVLPLVETTSAEGMQFSFSGLETTVNRIVKKRPVGAVALEDEERRALAREAFRTAFEHLASRVVLGLKHLRAQDPAASLKISTLVVSGGVASNKFLRTVLRRFMDVRGYEHIRLLFPPPSLCVDNAAMIAWAGMEMYEAGWRSDLSCQSLRKWSLDPQSADGGILGVPSWLRRTDREL
ncbi:MAG: 60S ribosomal protein L12 [Chaenotheca gracillima]|nr:MAG: 60S ribosomal protein L12 [Chaenotheca gracillima]